MQVFGVEHFVRGGEAGFLQDAHMHMADGKNALEHIGLFFGVGLVDHTHIALASCPRLVSVDARNDNQLVLGFFLYIYQAGNIVQNSFLIVG